MLIIFMYFNHVLTFSMNLFQKCKDIKAPVYRLFVRWSQFSDCYLLVWRIRYPLSVRVLSHFAVFFVKMNGLRCWFHTVYDINASLHSCSLYRRRKNAYAFVISWRRASFWAFRGSWCFCYTREIFIDKLKVFTTLDNLIIMGTVANLFVSLLKKSNQILFHFACLFKL